MQAKANIQRGFAAWMVAAITLVLTVLPLGSLSEQITPSAEAQTGTTSPSATPQDKGWSTNESLYNKCSFRRGSGPAEAYANQLCWIDLSGIIEKISSQTQKLPGSPDGYISTVPTRITKDLGRYELSFDISQRSENPNKNDRSVWNRNKDLLNIHRDRIANAVFGGSIDGNDYFTRIANDNLNFPGLSFKGAGITDSNQMTKFEFRNITLKDKQTQKTVSNYRLNVMDAAQTRDTRNSFTRGEGLSVDTPNDPSKVSLFTRFTPNGYVKACDPNDLGGTRPNLFGTAIEDYYDEADITQKDFFCFDNTNSKDAGSYLVGGDGISNLDVGLFTRKEFQAFALAINIGRMTGGVEPTDTSMEQAATGQATSFDFGMAIRDDGQETTVPYQGAGIYTQQVRRMDASDSQGSKAADQMVFKSAASGQQKDKALARYSPEWKCTLSGSSTGSFTITENQAPAGFKLENNASTGTSKLVYNNEASVPVSCKVTWKPRFKAASLALHKTVDGTAQGFSDVQNRRFRIEYSCKEPAGFSKAFPAIKLNDGVDLTAGETNTVQGLPAGSTCDVSEKFIDQDPAAPGESLKVTVNGVSVPLNNNEAKKTLTLEEGTNGIAGSSRADINNKYDYKTGTINVTKHIAGEPVSELGNPRDYRFELRCQGTDYSKTLVLNAQGTNDELNGSVRFEGVPVERDCFLRPLSGLSEEEAKTISFDGRTVTEADGKEIGVRDDGSYLMRLPDYTDDSAPSQSDTHIEARYSYKTRDVSVIKQVTGPAAALIGQDDTFPVHYRCEVPGDSSSKKEGDLEIAAGEENAGKIKDVRINSDCVVFEKPVNEQSAANLDSTTVRSSDSSDNVKNLENEEAKSSPVLKVNAAEGALQNRVIVSNHYVNKLGTVDVAKAISPDNEIDLSRLPANYQLGFRCGVRTVETSPGEFQNVDLTGTVTLADGENQKLKADITDPKLAALVNDQGGYMGVPYGNSCTFSEETPKTGSGILWSTDAAEQTLDVDKEENSVQITNSFAAAGDGITISQNQLGRSTMSEDVTYNLKCEDNGSPVDLGQFGSFTLGKDKQSITIPSTIATQGLTCSLQEATKDPGTRTKDGKSFEIDRDSTVSVDGNQEAFEDEAQIDSGSFEVGDQTVVTVSHDYNYVPRKVSATKNVEFDTNTGDYISEVRKNVKYNRLFDVQLTCTPPDGGSQISVSGKVSSQHSNDTGSQNISVDQIPDGSECTVAEGPTSAAEGIDFKQEVEADGNRRERSVDFTVTGDTPVTLINTYSRRLAKVDLTKIANTPIDIEATFPGRDKSEIYYTHTFNMTCKDPEGTEQESGELPPIAARTITGPGETEFAEVPVGASCQITGDKFGQLDLEKDDADGTKLQTHLRPEKVEWQLRREDQTSKTDTDLDDGETTSESFTVKDDEDNGGPGNDIDLTNYYQFVMSKMKMSKKIEAQPADLALLRKEKPDFNFRYQCKGAGYSRSDLGLPARLNAGDTEKFADGSLHFISDEVEVPSGAWCTVTEVEPSSTPSALEWNADPSTVAKRVNGENEPAASYDFVNQYKRRTAPVRLAALQEGYAGGIESASYSMNVVCKPQDEGDSEFTKNVEIPVARTNSLDTVAGEKEPTAGEVVDLPVGYDCTLDMNNSSALKPRPQLEVTQGQRSPYVEFGTWFNGQPSESNPDRKIATVGADEVTPEMKKNTYDFSIPDDVRSVSGAPVMTVASEAMNLRAKVDVSFKKVTRGAAGKDRKFDFVTSCGDNFQLSDGQTHQIKSVDVERECEIYENESEDGATPVISYEDLPSDTRLLNVYAVNGIKSEGQASGSYWGFNVAPVEDAADTSTSGPKWALTAVNLYPGVKLKKTIDGAPISSVTGAVADTAVLADDAETMRFHYSVTNDGAFPIKELAVQEPELAGYTLIADDGKEYKVDQEGRIPREVCSFGDSELPVDGTRECSFDVKIDASKEETYTYRGTATLTGTAAGADMKVTAEDDYGAIRLSKSLGFLLPDTGMQTLVWALLFGLILLAVGLWYYLRNRDEDEEE